MLRNVQIKRVGSREFNRLMHSKDQSYPCSSFYRVHVTVAISDYREIIFWFIFIVSRRIREQYASFLVVFIRNCVVYKIFKRGDNWIAHPRVNRPSDHLTSKNCKCAAVCYRAVPNALRSTVAWHTIRTSIICNCISMKNQIPAKLTFI